MEKDQVLSAYIDLKNSEHVFYAGDPILGHLNIVVQKGDAFTLHDVAIKWKCEVIITCPGIKSRNWNVQGNGIVNYLRNSKSKLTKGVSSYSFLLFLPHNIPQSLQLKYGSISYILKVRIKFKEYSSYLQARTHFTVLKTHVLRADRQIPQTYLINQDILDGGEIVGYLRLPSPEFLIEDELQYQIQLHNRSGRGLQWVSLRLIQEFTYDFGQSTSESEASLPKRETHFLWRKDWDGALPHGKVTLQKAHSGVFKGLIPSNALEKAHIIHMSYFFAVKLRSYLRSTIFEMKIPLNIGTSITYVKESKE